MTSHNVLYDPSIFPSPTQFMPERWLEASAPNKERLDKYFVAFGKGTRMCQGMDFAYAELYLTLTTLLRRFEFQLYETTYERDVKVVRDNFIGEALPESLGVRVRIVSELE
ncbi:hypothetical protein MMC24_004121 [Lignoscripta atroalba]|nr:hypothetical protein [Lignoscripta atroalba]